MRLVKTFLFLIANGFITIGFSQVAARFSNGQIVNLNQAIGGRIIEEVRFEGVENNNNKIPYYKITGTPFWQDKWQLASLYNNNRLLGILPVKINIATNEIYILRNEEELVVNENITSIIFFKEKDTSISTAAFISYVPNLFLNNKKIDDFVQVLNYGNYQLLKYIKRKVSASDSLLLKRYYFSEDRYYFLKSGDKIERIKKLNKDNVLAFLPASSAFADWIKANNIDFKREDDVVRFLDYYNTAKAK